jgi:CRISPR-associated protein Cas1
MATLYVQEQGAHVRKKDTQIIVTKEGRTLDEAPLANVEQVVLMGRGVQISTALLVALIERGAPVTLTNQHGNRHDATLSGGPSRFGELRTRQMALVTTPAAALLLARQVIAAKLHNQRRLLERTGWPSAPTAIAQIEQALAAVDQAATIDSLRGYEGAAAAAYFGAWRAALPPAWGFAGRAFYPPPDPINAALSFGYTLALHNVLAAVQITGLDPYLGTFHVPEPGRPSLALDLLEEFRPVAVDRLVLELVQTQALDRRHFARPAERPAAMYLTEAGRALLIDRYEALLHSQVRLPNGDHTPLRRVMLLQVQQVARIIRGEQEQYIGFRG